MIDPSSFPIDSNLIRIVLFRRGDQLSSRCLSSWSGLRDTSVNCGSEVDLIRDVEGYFTSNCVKAKRPRLIFIATNEKNETILDRLRARKFIPLVDVLTVFSAPSAAALTSLEEFIIEAQFMLQADTFLSYGISQINDVIEYERMKSGKGWCERDKERDTLCDQRRAVQNQTNHGSWCQIYINSTIS